MREISVRVFGYQLASPQQTIGWVVPCDLAEPLDWERAGSLLLVRICRRLCRATHLRLIETDMVTQVFVKGTARRLSLKSLTNREVQEKRIPQHLIVALCCIASSCGDPS